MARLAIPAVEESDDEFPELAELIAGKGGKGSTTIKSRDAPETGKSKRSVKTNKVPGSERMDMVEDDGVAKEVKPKSRKRVLGKTTENPLLRPFSEEPGTGRKVRSRKIEAQVGEILVAKIKATKKEALEQVEDDDRGRSETLTGPVRTTTASELREPRARPRSRVLAKEVKTPAPGKATSKKTETTKARSEVVKNSRAKSRSTTPQEPERTHEAEQSESEDEAPRTLSRKSKAKLPTNLVSEDEEEADLAEDSDDLSDFIVNDSTCLTIEDSEIEIPPPRSTRKLVKGRRPIREDSPGDDLELRMEKLGIRDDLEEDDSDPFRFPAKQIKSSVKERTLNAGRGKKQTEEPHPKTNQFPKGVSHMNENTSSGGSDDIDLFLEKGLKGLGLEKPSKENISKPVVDRRKERARANTKESVSYSNLDDPFTLQFSPPATKPRTVSKELRFATPPSSPETKPRTLQSPKKLPRIPSTPHRPSMDSFWEQDVINDWNDEYSPKKTPKPRSKFEPDEDNDVSDGVLLFSPTKKSLVKQGRLVKEAKKAFSEKKHALATSFLAELDATITNNQVSLLAASTGGIKIIWSKKLNTTAGRANWKRETIKSSSILPDGKPKPPTYKHHASIELAEKVIDDEDRLLNVIAHEFCHLANFMVSNVKTNPHGKEFKAWGAKVTAKFGGRGVEVTTKHSYQIDYKYVWECVNCGLEFKRHSKSIDPVRHQCGSCKCKLVQTKPVPRAGATGMGKPRVSEYQLFVKENMKKIREENPGSPQKEIMGLVGKRYKELKANKLGLNVSVDKVAGSKESTPDDDVGDVVRKLDFLDLTSP